MIYMLEPDGNLSDSWLFFEDNPQGRLVVRKEYCDLACERCGKIDEGVAISRGLSTKFAFRSKRDYLATSEDWICVSDRFRDYVQYMRFEGLSFLPIVNTGFSVVLPQLFVETDELNAGFENYNQCSSCGRFGERIIGPLIGGMDIPHLDTTFFASSIANENVKVSYRPIFAREVIVEALQSQKFVGIDFVESM